MENYNPLAKVCGQMGKKITTLIKKEYNLRSFFCSLVSLCIFYSFIIIISYFLFPVTEMCQNHTLTALSKGCREIFSLETPKSPLNLKIAVELCRSRNGTARLSQDQQLQAVATEGALLSIIAAQKLSPTSRYVWTGIRTASSYVRCCYCYVKLPRSSISSNVTFSISWWLLLSLFLLSFSSLFDIFIFPSLFLL